MPTRFHKNIRMAEWDYSQSAVYMVTMCVSDRTHRFGSISDADEMYLNDAGRMILQELLRVESDHPHSTIIESVIMPNHLHMLIGISLALDVRHSSGLPDIIGGFKSHTTNRYIKGVRMGLLPPFHKKLWQEGYYETVMRNERMTEERRQYIINNPASWRHDPEMNSPNDVTHKG